MEKKHKTHLNKKPPNSSCLTTKFIIYLKLTMAKLRKHGQTSRTERRIEAELRQEYYNSLTPQQKLGRTPIN